MSASVGERLSYRFQQPPEWEALLDCVQAHYQSGQPYEHQIDAAAVVMREIATIAVEPQERLRLYGLGLIACRYGREMSTPEGGERLVQRAVDELTGFEHQTYAGRNHERYNLGLRVDEINGERLKPVALDLVRPHALAMPVAERLVSDVLQTTNFLPDQCTRHLNTPSMLAKILRGKPAMHEVAANVLTGAAMVTRTALHVAYVQRSRRWWQRRGIDHPNPLISDVMSPAEIRAMDLKAVAKRLAILRNDELLGVGLPAITFTDGVFGVDTTNIPSQPTPREPLADGEYYTIDRPRHHARLLCPAMHVPGMVSHAAQLMPEIVARGVEHFEANKRA